MITRHNYEEFFLLYADGELSASDKEAVELFVQENTDLADELVLFQQMKLPAEPVVFTDKHSLYRSASGEISPANYEEQFLLYIDNELDSAGKEKVETFVLQHPAYQAAFTVLKQTKLLPETLVYPDKSSLYRKEEKPVVYLRWWKIAAAAAVIGLAVLVWAVLPGNTNKQQLAKQYTPVNPAGTHTNQVTEPRPAIPNTAALVKKEEKTAMPFAGNPTELQASTGIDKNNPADPQKQTAQNGITSLPEQVKKETIVAVTTAPLVNAQQMEKLIAETHSLPETDMMKPAIQPDNTAPTNTTAQQVVYKELDTDDDKKSLYIGSVEINKDKLRGLIRKAGSFFKSKARQDEDIAEPAPKSNKGIIQ